MKSIAKKTTPFLHFLLTHPKHRPPCSIAHPCASCAAAAAAAGTGVVAMHGARTMSAPSVTFGPRAGNPMTSTLRHHGAGLCTAPACCISLASVAEGEDQPPTGICGCAASGWHPINPTWYCVLAAPSWTAAAAKTETSISQLIPILKGRDQIRMCAHKTGFKMKHETQIFIYISTQCKQWDVHIRLNQNGHKNRDVWFNYLPKMKLKFDRLNFAQNIIQSRQSWNKKANELHLPADAGKKVAPPALTIPYLVL